MSSHCHYMGQPGPSLHVSVSFTAFCQVFFFFVLCLLILTSVSLAYPFPLHHLFLLMLSLGCWSILNTPVVQRCCRKTPTHLFGIFFSLRSITWPTGVYGYAGADGRPFAAASVKHGIVVGEVSLLTLPSHRHSEDGRPHPASASDASNKVRTKLTYLFGLVVIATSQGHFLIASSMLRHV